MSADLSLIEAQIVNALETINELKKVYDHEPLEISVLPAGSMFYVGFNQEDESSPNTSYVTHKWAIRVYVKLQDAKKAQDEIKALITKVISALKTDRKLGGTCLYSSINGGSIGVFDDKLNPQIIAELNFSATVYEG